MIEASAIRPAAKGKSDFFSWQLYRWIKKKPEYWRVFEGVWNSFDGYNPDRPVLYIGVIDDCCFMGAPLRQICRHGAKLDSWAMCHKEHRVNEWLDITDVFWERYFEKGVCAIHGDIAHSWRYSVNKPERFCEYCGKKEKRTLVFRPKTIWQSC